MLPVKSMRVLNFQDANLRSLQDAVSTAVNPVLATAFLDGNSFDSLQLSTAPTILAHGLGRNYRGYVITMQDADATIYVASGDQLHPNSQIVLRASASVTVSLVVF